MASWLDGFYDNSWLKLVRYNSTLNKFQAGNTAIPNVRAVDDWTALQAIPKTSANDELIVHVRDQPANKSMWIYKHSLGRWKTVDTTFGPHAKSIMWMGDYSGTLTGNTTLGVGYLQAARTPYYGESVSMPTVNASGTYMRHYRFNRGCSKASGGSIAFDKPSRSLKWKAPGDTAGSDGGYGAPVVVSTPGWYKLESGTPGMDMVCSIYPSLEPAASTSDSVTLAALTNPFISMHGLSTVPGHFNALYGNPFREKQYPFFATFMTPADFQNSYPQWQDIDSDITVIWFHTTGTSTISGANTSVGNLENVIQRRKDRGSHVIVLSLGEWNGNSDTTVRMHLHINQRLMESASNIGFEFLDVNSILRSTTGTLSDPLTTGYLATDQLTLSSKGAYMVAKYVLYPALSKYLPNITQKANPAIPYSSTDNYGNLLTNGLFTGYATVSGTKGTGVTGDLGTAWSCSRGTGSTITAVCTMPDSASPIARTDGYPGNWARFVISNNNASNVAGESITLTQTSNVSSSNYTAGDIVQFSGTLRISAANAGGGAGIRAINVRVTTDKGNSIVMGDNSTTTNYMLGNLNGEDVIYNLVSMPMILGSGLTLLNIIMTITFEAGGAATIDLGQDWMLRKLV